MNSVIVLCGLPGAGKTHRAREVANRKRGTIIVSADDYDQQNPCRTGAHGLCLRQYVQQLQTGAPRVIVDNTNTTTLEIAPYVALAAAFGYAVHIWLVECDPLFATRRRPYIDAFKLTAMASRLRRLPSTIPPWWPPLLIIPQWQHPAAEALLRRVTETALAPLLDERATVNNEPILPAIASDLPAPWNEDRLRLADDDVL